MLPTTSGSSSHSVVLPNEEAMHRLVTDIAIALEPGDLITLSGDLGAGKTTLARAIIRAAAGDPNLIVPSPTFTLVEVYETPRGTYWHFDLYRLDDPQQVYELGWEEALAEGIVLLEWPDRLGSLLPQHLSVTLELASEDGRRAILDV